MKTVTFDVGGRYYKVSKSLVEEGMASNSMLARLVSKTWSKGNCNEVIFIDRDGDRFAYVLDYLRYGEVKLPVNVSMEYLKKDMDFYGIKINESQMKTEDFLLAKLDEFSKEIGRLNKAKAEFEKEYDQKMKKINHEKVLVIMANRLIENFYKGKASSIVIPEILKENERDSDHQINYRDLEDINMYLYKYGIKASPVNVYFELFGPSEWISDDSYVFAYQKRRRVSYQWSSNIDIDEPEPELTYCEHRNRAALQALHPVIKVDLKRM